MLTSSRYFLIGLSAAGLLMAQHNGGGGSGIGPTQATPPRPPASIGLQRQVGGYTGISTPGLVQQSIGLQHQPGGYTGISTGAYRSMQNYNPQRGYGSQPPTNINRVIGGHGHDQNRDRGWRGGYVIPFYPIYGYGSSSYDSFAYSPLVDTSSEQNAQVTANLLGEQIQRLTAEVEALRNSQRVPLDAPLPPEDRAPAQKPIILVLHSGKKLEVQNYAIMNGVLWDFSKENSPRIPLESVDGPASAKATEESGASFPTESFVKNPS